MKVVIVSSYFVGFVCMTSDNDTPALHGNIFVFGTTKLNRP